VWGDIIAARQQGYRMTNIPTDLLRTFVSVVELRSFTRAAKAQGMTQPAVSAQIRRLHDLLGVDLLDKSAPGVTLTPMGELVLDFARRLLSVNDHIVHLANPNSTAQLVRIGVPGDCMGAELFNMLAAIRSLWPGVRFSVQGAGQRRLLQYLKEDEVDIALALVTDEPDDAARHYWSEDLVWVRGKSTTLDPDAPVPLVSYKDVCVCHRIGVLALEKVGRVAELVFRATNAEALRSAVAAGLGVMVVPRRRIPANLVEWTDGPLPPLPRVFCGIFVREGAGSEMLDQLADHFAEILRPPALMSPARIFASPRDVLSAVAATSV
jgi:DNA-binding transcriptional LysR family regulator